jgi:hypothetical protein
VGCSGEALEVSRAIVMVLLILKSEPKKAMEDDFTGRQAEDESSSLGSSTRSMVWGTLQGIAIKEETSRK